MKILHKILCFLGFHIFGCICWRGLYFEHRRCIHCRYEKFLKKTRTGRDRERKKEEK